MDNLKFRQWMGTGWHHWGFIEGYFTGPITNQQPNPKHYQFTGLTDRNGVEIYEGDIVTHKNLPKENEEVYWNDAEACFACRGGSSESWLDSGYEVIGNIHQGCQFI